MARDDFEKNGLFLHCPDCNQDYRADASIGQLSLPGINFTAEIRGNLVVLRTFCPKCGQKRQQVVANDVSFLGV